MTHISSKIAHHKHVLGNAHPLGDIALKATHHKRVPSTASTLSEYFPKGIIYFYAFPTGEDSNFYNQVPTFDEELVSGRPLVCAGTDVKVLSFAASVDSYSLYAVAKSTGICNPRNIISLPQEIGPDITGHQRNELIKLALNEHVADSQLIMAQPFLDHLVHKKFKIKPELSVALNDKKNKSLYIPQQYIPKKYGKYKNGFEFAKDTRTFPLPSVVKITSSSSGDGVIICHNNAELEEVKKKFAKVAGTIMVEEFIQSSHNLCVQFGIPYNRALKPEIIGFNEQVTSAQGDFLGGIVNLKKDIPYLNDVKEVLVSQILPRIRTFGWYGIGGIDVLIRDDGKFYFIDPNFRMTATYAYVHLANKRQITMPIISFTGKIACDRSTFDNKILELVNGRESLLKIISLTNHDDTFRFNAGIQFESIADLKRKANTLLALGVTSTVLSNIAHAKFDYKID